VPSGTDVTHLVATFTTTGSAVAIAGTPQESGVTADDFTNAVTYRVAAADSSTRDHVVTVTTAGLAVGDAYEGGVIACIYRSGDPGYVAGETRGLVAATGDLADTVWSNVPATAAGSTGTAIGSGAASTAAIVAQSGCAAGAAYACYHSSGGGHSDRYLPSEDEHNKVWENSGALGGAALTSATYWTSSEYTAPGAWLQSFAGGGQSTDFKSSSCAVQAVRSF